VAVISVRDDGETVSYGVDGERLVLSGVPTWQFWAWRTEDEAQVQAIEDRANTKARGTLQAECVADAARMSQAEPEAKYTANYVSSRFGELFDRDVNEALLQWLPELSASVTGPVRANDGGTRRCTGR